jgi:hypothetical protein
MQNLKQPPIDRFVELPIDCISKFEPALIVISAFAVPTKPAARTEIIAISFFIVIYPFIDKLIVYVHKLMLICIEIGNIEQKCCENYKYFVFCCIFATGVFYGFFKPF